MIIAFSMELQRIESKSIRPMARVFEIHALTVEYGRLLIDADNITMTDVNLFGALSWRAMNRV